MDKGIEDWGVGYVFWARQGVAEGYGFGLGDCDVIVKYLGGLAKQCGLGRGGNGEL